MKQDLFSRVAEWLILDIDLDDAIDQGLFSFDEIDEVYSILDMDAGQRKPC